MRLDTIDKDNKTNRKEMFSLKHSRSDITY